MRLLSVYAGEPSSHTILEYLIRKYRINEFNVSALIQCVLPFHDTKVSGLLHCCLR
jgi:U3 small nucleolar RNA-associated protein 10